MQSWRRVLTRTSLLWPLIVVFAAGSTVAAEKVTATLLVKDSLAALNQQATIEAKLTAKGLLKDSPLGGEPLELVIDGVVAATAMTGGDGTAFLSNLPKARSINSVRVRVGNSPRVAPSEGQANLVVWERRNPILVVEMASLMEEGLSTGPLPGLVPNIQPEFKPIPDAADELGKLTKFYYGAIYIVPSPTGADGFQATVETRDWLKIHKFPAGLVLVLPPGDDALGATIDELHAAGWKTIKTGIGRSKAFADAFLRRRLDVVMVPEPTKGEAPRKAKVAKDWKEVRKKLYPLGATSRKPLARSSSFYSRISSIMINARIQRF
jgi:hypothetical protein